MKTTATTSPSLGKPIVCIALALARQMAVGSAVSHLKLKRQVMSPKIPFTEFILLHLLHQQLLCNYLAEWES